MTRHIIQDRLRLPRVDYRIFIFVIRLFVDQAVLMQNRTHDNDPTSAQH